MSQSKPTPNPEEDADDPLAPIREEREAVEHLASQEREDSLAAWARVMLALVDGEDADPDDLEKAGLPRGDQ